jgi:cobalt-zinc-cadmium efflux system protein
MTLADRAPTKKHTFGLYRAEILAAFVNAQVLLLVSGYILFESYRRFREPPEIQTTLMLWVAVAGLAANFVSMMLLRSAQGESLNMKAVYLEAVTDMLASVGVIAAALLMPVTGWLWLDPAISAGIGLLILPRTISILRQSAHILLEGTPIGIDLALLRKKLLEIPGVAEVHDLHLWTLTSGVNSATVHIKASPDSERDRVREEVQKTFQTQAGVDHATVQLEGGFDAACPAPQDHS